MYQLLLTLEKPVPHTFANFVIGKNHEAVHSLQQAIAQESSQKMIYLWGERGSGKTHLLQACLAQNPNIAVQDDVHLLDEQEQIALFNHYNQIRKSYGVFISTGNTPPSQLAIRPDLATRLAWGLSYGLQPLSDEEKYIALQQHAQRLGIQLSEQIMRYCLQHLRRDLPTLIHWVSALDTWSRQHKKHITLPMLKTLLNAQDKGQVIGDEIA